MRMRPALAFHLFGLIVLRCASALVPQSQRAEWSREWESELWHVRRVRTPDHGVSWAAEREVARFCTGGFRDALCLRSLSGPRRILPAMAVGSAMQCVLLLVGLAAASYGVSRVVPGVSTIARSPLYRDAGGLMLIREAGRPDDSEPAISAEQYRTWQRRRQGLFDGFAFYRVAKQTLSGASQSEFTVQIAHASSNLFDLMGLPVRIQISEGGAHSNLPWLILSDETWKRDFRGDRSIFGRVVRVDRRDAVVAGVAPPGAWRLPKRVDAWLMGADLDGAGFVLAKLKPSAEHAKWGESWRMTAITPNGSADDFLCSSIVEQVRRPWDIFLFAGLLACLALPATTSLPLGEYPQTARTLPWSTRLLRWSFLAVKLALLFSIAYFASLDLAYSHTTLDPVSSQYIQLIATFSICLFGLRWTLRDQRQRCPVCLRKLSHPAHVGQPSRTFLAWNGTELMCAGGHGLLHVPEMPTSWFSTQRWLYLDSSWEVLFADSSFAAAG